MGKPLAKREKPSQRDYNLDFKLRVVTLGEKGEMTYKQAQKAYGIKGRNMVLVWLRKHDTLGRSNPIIHIMKPPIQSEIPAQKIKSVSNVKKIKNLIINAMIDVFENQHGAGLRKIFTRTILDQKQEKK